ncbi:YecA family protein [Rhizobacter sp. Root1221]|uniref:YecA/YgfB family protein n=1 Tax=Rhizobacter sp. Root1221 TaxID=1736433 RepID=UPI0006F92E33|nr:YecA family protein [Rhizobacter sp. Root1221]KQV99605.1 hypothetical protein ASC87_02575 [Rhizobacter sp. Root1221]
MPPPVVASTAHDLTDEEFAELDDLLLETPQPLTPVDAVMLDGFLCGVLVQPVLLEPAVWLPFVFDFDGQPLPDDVDPTWRDRVTALTLRRYHALNHAIIEDGWFNPLVLEFDDENPREPIPEGEIDPLAGLSEVSQPLMPWVAGFQHAALSFPDLSEMPDDAVMAALARLYRHLPTETDEEREVVAVLDKEHPLATLDDAIEELVVTVADLADLTRDERFKVEQVRRDAPKVGRNDPCPCGSGKKFKQCHGAT